MFKLYVEKVEELEIKLPISVGSQEKQQNSRKTSPSLTTLRPLTVWIITFTGVFNQNHPQEKEMQKGKMVV